MKHARGYNYPIQPTEYVYKEPKIQDLPIAMGLLRTLPLVFLTKCVFSSTMVLHESISHVPAGFKASGSPLPTQEIKLFIALVQSNITGLAKIVDAVSVPSSSAYGQYLTAAEVSFIRSICFVSLYRYSSTRSPSMLNPRLPLSRPSWTGSHPMSHPCNPSPLPVISCRFPSPWRRRMGYSTQSSAHTLILPVGRRWSER
jgi:hypothetical protein